MEPAVRVQLAGLGEDNRQEGLCRRSSPHPLRPLLEAQFERATWRSQIRGGSGSPTSFPSRNSHDHVHIGDKLLTTPPFDDDLAIGRSGPECTAGKDHGDGQGKDVSYSLSRKLQESIKIYCAVNDGIINLVDVPPTSFLVTMEEYIREAPRAGQVANKTIVVAGTSISGLLANFKFLFMWRGAEPAASVLCCWKLLMR
ncbi:hypothetical protein ZWY2020_020680 [Hordeum vulgare]|nr:hypothetical protein ZWY2020_020680 [Hordeum vulgare]